MRTILFDLHQHPSHFNSAFKVANLLRAGGHKILFIGTQRFKQQICEAGFEYINQENVSLLDSVDRNHQIVFEPKFIRFLKGIKKDSQYRCWLAGINAYMAMLKKLKIDTVFLDEDINHKWTWYFKTDLKVIVFGSKPFTGSDLIVPPFTYSVLPKESTLHKIHNYFLWKFSAVKLKCSMFLLEVKTLGQNYYTFGKRHAKETGYSFKENIDFNHVYKWVFKDYEKIILMPEEIDYPREYPSNVHHIGQYGYIENKPNLKDRRYLAVIEDFEKRKENGDDLKLIYCSLGTLTYMYAKESVSFFKRIINVASNLSDCIIVISIGQFVNPEKFLPLPKNVFLFPKVSQTHILSKCTLMINHGGMNSIMECIHFNVPQLVFPLSLNWDQQGNAGKVFFHNIGLRGNLRNDSEKDIQKKITNLIDNYWSFHANISFIRQKIDLRYSDDKILEFLDTIMESAN